MTNSGTGKRGRARGRARGRGSRGRVFGDVGRGDAWGREMRNVWEREIGDAGTSRGNAGM